VLSAENHGLDLTDTVGVGRLRSNLEYLSRHFGSASVQSFFGDSTSKRGVQSFFGELQPADKPTDDIVEPKSRVKRFTSDNAVKVNRIEHLNRRHSKFVAIEWWGVVQHNEQVSMHLQGDDSLSIVLSEENHAVREFHLPLQQAAENKVVEGDGFTLLVTKCKGTHDPDESRIEVSYLSGYLFYD
jgi:hypothetical protein